MIKRAGKAVHAAGPGRVSNLTRQKGREWGLCVAYDGPRATTETDAVCKAHTDAGWPCGGWQLGLTPERTHSKQRMMSPREGQRRGPQRPCCHSSLPRNDTGVTSGRGSASSSRQRLRRVPGPAVAPDFHFGSNANPTQALF